MTQLNEKAINKVDEQELEDVNGGLAGGIGGPLCFFLPELPIQREVRGDGTVWVRCRSNCAGWHSCSCRHTPRCVQRMHKMAPGSAPGTLHPHDIRFNNHSAPDKVVTIP